MQVEMDLQMDDQQARRILELPTGHFTESQLAHAYRLKVRQYHPDLNGPEHEMSMRLINIARDILREYIADPSLSALSDPLAEAPSAQDQIVETDPETACTVADTGLFRRVQRERASGPELWQSRR